MHIIILFVSSLSIMNMTHYFVWQISCEVVWCMTKCSNTILRLVLWESIILSLGIISLLFRNVCCTHANSQWTPWPASWGVKLGREVLQRRMGKDVQEKGNSLSCYPKTSSECLFHEDLIIVWSSTLRDWFVIVSFRIKPSQSAFSCAGGERGSGILFEGEDLWLKYTEVRKKQIQ